MPSPKPTPTALVKLHGSPGHASRANKREPDLPPLIDPVTPGEAVPAEFTPSQRAEWEWTLANAPREMLRRIDRTLLASWCVAADVARTAAMELGNSGPFYKHKTRGVIIASAFRVHQMATLELIRLAEHMGFSPTARARIFRDGWEDRPAGSTLVAAPAAPAPGNAPSLARFIASAPGRKTA